MKLTDAKFVGSYPAYDLAPRGNLPEIAIGGRSNVGKSSLINSLVNKRNLAHTSKTPGKTRLLNYFAVTGGPGGKRVYLVDLPGFGYARVSSSLRRGWAALVENYIEGSPNLRGFVLLMDCRRGVQDEELQLVRYLLSVGKPVCPVLTKSDKLAKRMRAEVVRTTASVLMRLGDFVSFPVLHSSKDGMGNELIWRWMMEMIDAKSE